MSVTASITNISRCSLHDGPGIRTVVYLAGCGLRCQWCHNPETLTGGRILLYAPVKCAHCGRCVELCPAHHVIDGNDMRYIREGCTLCGRCADACPSGALTLCGREMTAREVFDEAVKDKHYYDVSGGGLTLSGGECLLRPDFCVELLALCRDAGISTAIESALNVPWSAVESVLPLTDRFFADLKLADPEEHKRYTGRDNRLILDNLALLARAAAKGIVTVRIPLIPGVSDTSENIAASASVIASLGEGVGEVELLRYNPLGESKYTLSGKEYHGFGGIQSDEKMLLLSGILTSALPARIKVTYI